jgi:hypothetical protein
MALADPLSWFTARLGGGSAFRKFDVAGAACRIEVSPSPRLCAFVAKISKGRPNPESALRRYLSYYNHFPRTGDNHNQQGSG